MADETPGSDLLAQAFRQANATFLDMVDAMSLLRALSTVPLHDITESELLHQALRVLALNQHLERCSVFLLEGEELVNAAGLDWADLVGLGAAERRYAPRRFRVSEGLVGMAAASGRLQHCRRASEDPRFVDRGCVESEAGAVIAVPVQANGETIGVLNVSHPHVDFFGETHERALQVFASFLGQMIVNHRLLAKMDALVKERTEQLEQALDEAQTLKRRYAEWSMLDELTGLHNRRHFFPEARAAVDRALRYGHPFSVLLIDVDHFKQINDTLGHAAGDGVLRDVAALLLAQVRESDVLARFGGEEFVLALPETELEGARALAERIRLAVRSEALCPRALTVSIGIAHRPVQPGAAGESAGEILERLIREADKALYFGKHHGRDQCRYYPEIADRAASE
ncbi:MAG: diguanylate cyclase [Thiohalomonadaceae bacterium]